MVTGIAWLKVVYGQGRIIRITACIFWVVDYYWNIIFVQKIYCAGGVPVTVHTLFWLVPWIIRALDGEILIESTAVDKNIKYIIYKMANFTEMKHIDKEVW